MSVLYHRQLYWHALAALTLLFTPVGCKRPATADATPANYGRYHMRGVVLSKSDNNEELTVRHGEIADLMPAMTMSYRVRTPAAAVDVHPGDEITGDVLVSKNNHDLLLDNLVLVRQARRAHPAGANR